jgi:hypothetical protein
VSTPRELRVNAFGSPTLNCELNSLSRALNGGAGAMAKTFGALARHCASRWFARNDAGAKLQAVFSHEALCPLLTNLDAASFELPVNAGATVVAAPLMDGRSVATSFVSCRPGPGLGPASHQVTPFTVKWCSLQASRVSPGDSRCRIFHQWCPRTRACRRESECPSRAMGGEHPAHDQSRAMARWQPSGCRRAPERVGAKREAVSGVAVIRRLLP